MTSLKFQSILVVVLLTFGTVARAQNGMLKSREALHFDGQTLFLASQGEEAGAHLKEYIPEGETLEAWTKLAATRVYPKLDDPKALATNLLRALKEQNPQAPSSMSQNPKTGEVIVDFVTWTPDNSLAEFNVFKYGKKPGGGIIAQQYALREYKDIPAFLKGLKPIRVRLVDLMASTGLSEGK